MNSVLWTRSCPTHDREPPKSYVSIAINGRVGLEVSPSYAGNVVFCSIMELPISTLTARDDDDDDSNSHRNTRPRSHHDPRKHQPRQIPLPPPRRRRTLILLPRRTLPIQRLPELVRDRPRNNVVAVCQAFLPLLIHTRGTIVNIYSISGHVHTP
ncbi:hypothetical protein K504DRAFT_505126 [Pleomassaria siparia CBS 279.74]|uniref:NAD(P)-binding protein n=1 Tax=Pleomassaria siparia CBS 279.74 TaxID=1314801 RepID=A0A6G1K040_9PLEO|nr:hypothetical protein K504DRAFT_505126 [Pleomassaria siparia CBS 279.74]